ncbi:MAG TPA: hypothetical protein VM711_01440 [Sphingomicrobium sp.]|nr:hypothetical protein [Sphingomicrobium sp.]
MKTSLFAAASAFALSSLSTPLLAQPMAMPGMTAPMPEKKTPPKKHVSQKSGAKNSPANKRAQKSRVPGKSDTPGADQPNSQTLATDHGAMPKGAQPSERGSQIPMGGSQTEAGVKPMPEQRSGGEQMPMTMPMDRPQSAHGQVRQMPMADITGGRHEMTMPGALGPYPMGRESSGTSWQPDASEHQGLMTMSGEWTLMAHGVLNLVYDSQNGRRGDDKAFASGMLMGMAQRPFGSGTLQFRAMVSPDPLMGPSGYPLLLASGETANGRDRLIDRQHPHDFFMELAASVSQNVGPKSSVFFYAGLPAEPAFGPPAFMHREAIMDSPEAPISHHWLDSTHIAFGVVTAGFVFDRLKFEVSRFNAREPDQHRWNIETGPLDSTAIRISWNPTNTLALQGSWGHFKDPEQLEPGVDQKRLSASLLYAREVAPGWKFAGTLAWGRKTVEHHDNDAYVAEASLKHRGWTMFGRGEMAKNRELVPNAEHGPAYEVGKISLGAVRDFRIADHVSIGAGGLFALNFVPEPLAPLYGGSNPTGLMVFVRIRLN